MRYADVVRGGHTSCLRHRHHLHTEIRTMGKGRDMSLYAVVDPATGDVVQEYPTATDEQMEQALSAAAKAHREWSRTIDAGRAGGADRARWPSCTPNVARSSPRSSSARWASRSTRRSVRSTSAPRSTSTTPTTPRSSSPTSPSTCSTVRQRADPRTARSAC